MQFGIQEAVLLMSAQVPLCQSLFCLLPSLGQTAGAHVLKDKTTGTEANQWWEQR